MAVLKWLPSANSGMVPAPNADGTVTLLGTGVAPGGLNALAASTGAALSVGVNIDTELDLFADFELFVTFVATPVADGLVKMYIVRSISEVVPGTPDYEDGSTAAIVPRNGYVGAFIIRGVSTAQRMILPEVSIPFKKFKVLLINECSTAFTAVNTHTLKARFGKYQSI